MGVVEEKDVTYAQKQTKEISAGIYVFDTEFLAEALPKLSASDNQGETYLIDMLKVARKNGRRVSSVVLTDTAQAERCSGRAQLIQLRTEYNRCRTSYWMLHGVMTTDPASAWTDADASMGMDTTICPNTQLRKNTIIGEDCRVEPDSTSIDANIGDGAEVCRVHVISAGTEDRVNIGPSTYLWPDTRLGPKTKVGGFCETKSIEVGRGTKIPHLSCAGDATIGEATNTEATTISASYDEVNRHHSTMGSYCRTGADSAFVAPVHTSDGVYTGGGITMRHGIPAGALAVSQLDMRIIPGWVVEHRPDTDTARAVTGEVETVGINSFGAESITKSLAPDSNSGDKQITTTLQARIKTGIEMAGLLKMPWKRLVIVSGHSHHQLAEGMVKALDTEIPPTTIYDFASGEVYVWYNESVRGCDMFCTQSISGDMSKWFMEQLIMADALKRASAKRVTVVAPLYPYSRQNKEYQGREPIPARLMADLYKTAGASRLMSVNIHASQEQGFFVGPAGHLMAVPVPIDYVRIRVGLNRVTVVSPDAGRTHVVEKWANWLGGNPLAFIHKIRDTTRPNAAVANRVADKVEGRTYVLVDDLTDADGTIAEAVGVLKATGVESVLVAVTHGMLSDPATGRLSECGV